MILASYTSRGVLYAAKIRVGTPAGVHVPEAVLALDAVQAASAGSAIARTSGTIRRVNQRGIRAPSRRPTAMPFGSGYGARPPVVRSTDRSQAFNRPRSSGMCAPVIRSRDVGLEIPEVFPWCQPPSRARNTSRVRKPCPRPGPLLPCGEQLTRRLEAATRLCVAASFVHTLDTGD